tara:strand:+ start:136 stop:1449 length:1314 start_codon:yes stop_codon:yes gene_type:complete
MTKIQKIITIIFSLLIINSYFFGFFYQENSIGSGGYKGDLDWMWKNFQIFKNENLLQAIKSNDFFGNRSPLLYIINIYLNPFINDIDNYRFSITIFSLLASYTLFLCIKEKYKNINFEIILFLSLIILLSPFYRTSSFWGMETQYGIISSLISIYFFLKTNELKKISYRYIFLTIFFSSLTVYFDLKLVIIPLFIFLKILFSNLNNNIKLFSSLSFLLLAIPYFYLIFLWKGIVPEATQVSNPLQITHLVNSKFHMVNILFATNMLGFYLFPFLLLKKNFYKSIKITPNIFNLVLLLLFVSYLLYFISADLYDFVDKIPRESGGYKDFWGLGYSEKLGNILFDSRIFSISFNVIIYLISVLIIILFINTNYINFFLILFFLILSIALFPLMQEYFDPYIYIISLLLTKNEYDFNFSKCTFVFLYFSFFLASSIIYYS